MYRGFDVNLNVKRDLAFWDYYSEGEELYSESWATVRPSLKSFIQNDKTLDGAGIQRVWFPKVKVDVFISHSHDDLETAIFLAGWLKKVFGLTAFIDECVWGHCDELLKEIDIVHCKKGPDLYSYELRNHSTSHVHMMLATALNMMMDRTECIFFLNSPNSIKSYDDIDKTESPWIYAEIAATHFLRIRIPARRKKLVESMSGFSGTLEHMEKGAKILHPVDLSHLNKIDLDDMKEWRRSLIQGTHPLDILYDLHEPLRRGL